MKLRNLHTEVKIKFLNIRSKHTHVFPLPHYFSYLTCKAPAYCKLDCWPWEENDSWAQEWPTPAECKFWENSSRVRVTCLCWAHAAKLRQQLMWTYSQRFSHLLNKVLKGFSERSIPSPNLLQTSAEFSNDMESQHSAKVCKPKNRKVLKSLIP